MTNDYYPKLRVFWHESGHFVAQQYNAKLFGGKGTEYVMIKKVETLNQNFDYEGATKHKILHQEELLEHPSSAIASAAYGCIFQCIMYRFPLDYCLSPKGKGTHGHHDYEAITWILSKIPNGLKNRQLLLSCIQEFFNEIKDNQEFIDLFNIDNSDLISSTSDEFYINMEEIRKRFQSFFENHEAHYKEFVSRIEIILRS